MSTCERPDGLALGDQAGQAVQGLRPEHQVHIGARATMASPSWLATQPPTPMMRLGFCFRCFTRPRSWNPSPAPSRTEQVLKRITSASSGLSVSRARRQPRAHPPSCPSRTRSITQVGGSTPPITTNRFSKKPIASGWFFCVEPGEARLRPPWVNRDQPAPAGSGPALSHLYFAAFSLPSGSPGGRRLSVTQLRTLA